jgi:hypothetical protein
VQPQNTVELKHKLWEDVAEEIDLHQKFEYCRFPPTDSADRFVATCEGEGS